MAATKLPDREPEITVEIIPWFRRISYVSWKAWVKERCYRILDGW